MKRLTMFILHGVGFYAGIKIYRIENSETNSFGVDVKGVDVT